MDEIIELLRKTILVKVGIDVRDLKSLRESYLRLLCERDKLIDSDSIRLNVKQTASLEMVERKIDAVYNEVLETLSHYIPHAVTKLFLRED